MEKTIINKTNDWETKVTIAPSTDDWGGCFYPTAYVSVKYSKNGTKLFEVCFEKILTNTPFMNGAIATQEADLLIQGDLSKVGLGGLSTLDIYKDWNLRTLPISIPLDMIGKLEESLGLNYIDQEQINGYCCPSERDFYNSEIIL